MKRVYPMKPERTKKDRLRADILLIAALLALALGFFAVQRLSRKNGALAVVYVNGERTAEYPLAEDTTVTLHAPNGGYNILVISGGTADVTDTEKKHTIKIRTDIKDADYIDSLVWVGDTSKGYVLIAIKNALNTAGATLTWTDKGEGTIPVEFTAHQDGLETDGYAPCEVIFFDPAA